jgi:hypothetical protein
VRRSKQGGPDHADHDRPDGEVLVASAVLAEHALGEEHQHQQPGREGRLHDHQGRQHQGDDLKRPAEHREARAGEPACPLDQAPSQSQPQVLVVGRLLGVERLQSDP